MYSSTQRLLVGAALASGVFLGLRAATRRRYSFTHRVVVITGGSRGLGLVLARRLAAEGARLVLLARDAEELDRAAAELAHHHRATVLAIPCDLRVQQQVDHAIAETIETFGRIDVLINNAGVIQVGPIEHMTADDFRDSLDIHIMAPVYTALAAVPFMKRQGHGRIVNISSFGGKVAVPHLAPYCAGKFGLVGFSEALHAELRRHNIFVTTICPWLMRTGSPPNAFFKGQHQREYTWFALGGAPPGVSQSADTAARRIIEATRRGDARLILTFKGKLVAAVNELFPGLTAAALALMNRALPGPAGAEGDELRTGWESFTDWAPSRLTRYSDRATLMNNELPPRTARAMEHGV